MIAEHVSATFADIPTVADHCAEESGKAHAKHQKRIAESLYLMLKSSGIN